MLVVLRRFIICVGIFMGLGTSIPMPVQAATVNDVSVGTDFACAVTAGNVYCWGKNDFGQLGTNQAPGTYAGARQVVIQGGAPLSGVSQITSQGNWTCALKTGQIWCWGGTVATNYAQRAGSLVGGGYISDATAIAVGGSATGAPFYCAIRSSQSSSVWCWGTNGSGQLGLNHTRAPADSYARQVLTPSSSVPITHVALTNATGLSAGNFHICATVSMANPKLGNYVYCWGSNGNGEIGNGRSGVNERALTATQLKTAAGVAIGGIASVSVSPLHSCAVLKNTEVMCWGYGRNYELGQGAQSSSSRAVSVKVDATTKLTGVYAISAGEEFTCAVKASSIWCWGANKYGQFGDDLLIPSQYAARTVTTILEVVDFDTSKQNVCAVNGSTAASRKVFCVGNNTYGQLGNRTLVSSRIHVAVKYHDSGLTFP